MRTALLFCALTLAAPAICAQQTPTTGDQTANVQTGRSAAQDTPVNAPPSDPRAITPADSGSAIDKPALVEAMPQTGAHAPVVPNAAQAEPPAHARLRKIRPPVTPAQGAAQNADALRPVDQRKSSTHDPK